jgi:hypothetical protein
MKEKISPSKFKATCLTLPDQANKTGRPIIVTENGDPSVQVIPLPSPKKKGNWLGSFKYTGRITGDIISPSMVEK